MINAKTFLEKRYNEDLELDDAIHTAILTLKEGMEGQMSENSLEIGIVTFDATAAQGSASVFRKLATTEVKDYLANIV